MSRYRNDLPQMGTELFLTDGGIETTLIFHDGFDLPEFAAFVLYGHDEGRRALRRYFRTYAEIARRGGFGFVLESATWRASPGWGRRIGFDERAIADVNHKAIAMLEEIRLEYEGPGSSMVVSGCVGPHGDGYRPDERLTPEQAQRYHGFQVDVLADTAADMVTAVTMTHTGEAIGVVRAAAAAGIPSVISFTTETDGRLPSGETLEDAIRTVDDATDGGPAYYMINCAHTSHFEDRLHEGDGWRERVRGLRTNASRLSHAELDEAESLDDGDPVEFGACHADLLDAFEHLTVVGGCCGTDHRHVGEVARSVRRRAELAF